MKKEINYTLHAGKKIAERGINKSLIESAILSPDTVLKDKFDSVLIFMQLKKRTINISELFIER